MDVRLREKFQRLISSDPRAAHHAYVISNLKYDEAKHAVCDWLLRAGIKGNILAEYVIDKHGADTFKMIAFIVAQVNRAPRRPVLARDMVRGPA